MRSSAAASSLEKPLHNRVSCEWVGFLWQAMSCEAALILGILARHCCHWLPRMAGQDAERLLCSGFLAFNESTRPLGSAGRAAVERLGCFWL
ncbi:MAG TPA: hypothetical protein PLV25_02735, partial [Opitutales bacterium]|nr:hypothetical protein [Opitutales bacterium]